MSNNLNRKNIKVVPILVGSISEKSEARFGAILAAYLAAENTFFVVSSDFCHWYVLLETQAALIQSLQRGTRFQYTHYYTKATDTSGIRLARGVTPAEDYPIWKSITRLDREAMDILTLPPSTASKAHSEFARYLSQTKNTICGRHPIGVLLGALGALETAKGTKSTVTWVRYEQSSHCNTIRDSSVSYASAYVHF